VSGTAKGTPSLNAFLKAEREQAVSGCNNNILLSMKHVRPWSVRGVCDSWCGPKALTSSSIVCL